MDSDGGVAEQPHHSRGHMSPDDHNWEGNERRERVKGRSRSTKEKDRDSAERKRSRSSLRGKSSTSPDKRKKHSPGAQISASPERVRRKHQRSRSRGTERSTQETPITAVLRDLRDDIQENEDMQLYEHQIYHDGVGDIDPYHTQKAGGCVYIEHQSGFTSVPRNLAFESSSTCNLPSQSPWGCLPGGNQLTALEVAIAAQKLWMPFADLCLGLLAGLTLMQTIVVGQLFGTTPESAQIFVSIYGRFSLIFTILFYVLIVVSLICVFDRLDVAHCDWTYFYEMWSLQPRLSWLLIPFYLCGAICTLSAARSDDWIHLSQFKMSSHNSSFTISEEELQRLQNWHVLNTLRCVCVVLGWFVMAMCQPRDQLLNHLSGILSYEATNPTSESLNLQNY